VQKRLNLSICRIGCGLEWAERCTSSIVFARWRQCALMEGHVSVTCRITLNHPSTATMRLMSNYTCYLWTRSLRQSHRQPSASSRVLYCGRSTQHSHLVYSVCCVHVSTSSEVVVKLTTLLAGCWSSAIIKHRLYSAASAAVNQMTSVDDVTQMPLDAESLPSPVTSQTALSNDAPRHRIANESVIDILCQ